MKVFILAFLVSLPLFSEIRLPQNFQADFSQKITNTKGKVLHYSGKILFSNERYFKWEYRTPTQKQVCSDGNEIEIVDHDLEQVSHYYISKGIDIVKILKEAMLYSPNIYVAKYEGKNYTIQLYKEQLHSIAYFDDLDNKVQIAFEGIKYGKGNLPRKRMQCHAPAGYDRIEG